MSLKKSWGKRRNRGIDNFFDIVVACEISNRLVVIILIYLGSLIFMGNRKGLIAAVIASVVFMLFFGCCRSNLVY